MSKTVGEFLKSFPIPLQHRESRHNHLWVFWSQYDDTPNISYLVDRSTQMIYEKIKFAFSNTEVNTTFISQFWAPVNIDGRWLLSTSGQTFAVSDLTDHLAMYRLKSAKYQYIIDANHIDIERDPMIRRGGPATAFMSRMPYMDNLVRIPLRPESLYYCWNISIMVPICSRSRSCIGVVECTMTEYDTYSFYSSLLNMTRAIKNAGLNMLHVQELIPYHTINGLKTARDEIAKALEIVCGTHNLILAQVWIAYEDKSNVLFSSSLDDTRPTKMLALKLTGYLSNVNSPPQRVDKYYSVCDLFPQVTEELALKTLKDYESRYISKLHPLRLMYDMPADFGPFGSDTETSALAICLRSINTGDFDYAFEFIWLEHSNNVILLEALLLTLKRSLPSFKFAYGAELGDELNVIDVDSSTDTETFNIKIYNGRKPIDVDCIAYSHKKNARQLQSNSRSH
ncbi:hypothetical protein M8C21_029882 [Ambrosia artemisiifolia]|uniref:NLP1-9 GAF domain-containing protein n=1 Tax=Ambrosia artemisiifolia TaxID=4212 RepID=A0AAD5BX19_AMBAR|nr:hypothetical protein M8C21_029882 [Ambrosia artemisiifolia]